MTEVIAGPRLSDADHTRSKAAYDLIVSMGARRMVIGMIDDMLEGADPIIDEVENFMADSISQEGGSLGDDEQLKDFRENAIDGLTTELQEVRDALHDEYEQIGIDAFLSKIFGDFDAEYPVNDGAEG